MHLVGMFLGALLSLFSWQQLVAAAEQKRTPVVVASVIQKTVRSEKPLHGTVRAVKKSAVAVYVEGLVKKILVSSGDVVSRGDLLLRLDSREAEHTLALREAALQEAETRLKKALDFLTRYQQLEKGALITQDRLNEQIFEVNIRKSLLDQATVQREIAHDRLEQHRVKAPFDGVVVKKFVEENEWMHRGDPALLLVDPDTLELEVPVPEPWAESLSPGMQAFVGKSQKFHQKFQVKLRAVSPVSDPLSRARATYWITTQGKPGQDLILYLPIETSKQTILIPKDAVVHTVSKETFVYIVSGKNQLAQRIPVRLGEPVGPFFRVMEGLHGTESVVVRGNERLRSGQKVRIVP